MQQMLNIEKMFPDITFLDEVKNKIQESETANILCQTIKRTLDFCTDIDISVQGNISPKQLMLSRHIRRFKVGINWIVNENNNSLPIIRNFLFTEISSCHIKNCKEINIIKFKQLCAISPNIVKMYFEQAAATIPPELAEFYSNYDIEENKTMINSSEQSTPPAQPSATHILTSENRQQTPPTTPQEKRKQIQQSKNESFIENLKALIESHTPLTASMTATIETLLEFGPDKETVKNEAQKFAKEMFSSEINFHKQRQMFIVAKLSPEIFTKHLITWIETSPPFTSKTLPTALNFVFTMDLTKNNDLAAELLNYFFNQLGKKNPGEKLTSPAKNLLLVICKFSYPSLLKRLEEEIELCDTTYFNLVSEVFRLAKKYILRFHSSNANIFSALEKKFRAADPRIDQPLMKGLMDSNVIAKVISAPSSEEILEALFVSTSKETLFTECQRIAKITPDVVLSFMQSKFKSLLSPITADQSFFDSKQLNVINADIPTPADFVKHLVFLIKRRAEIFEASQITQLDAIIHSEIETCLLNLSNNQFEIMFSRLCIICPEHLFQILMRLDNKAAQTDNNNDDPQIFLNQILRLLNLYYFGINSGSSEDQSITSNFIKSNASTYVQIHQEFKEQVKEIQQQNLKKNFFSALITSAAECNDLDRVKIVVQQSQVFAISDDNKQDLSVPIFAKFMNLDPEQKTVHYLSSFLAPKKTCKWLELEIDQTLHGSKSKQYTINLLVICNSTRQHLRELYKTEANELVASLEEKLALLTGNIQKRNSMQFSPQLNRSSSGSASSSPKGSPSSSHNSSLGEADFTEVELFEDISLT